MSVVLLHYRQQVSEHEAEIDKLSEAIKKKDEKEKKYQGIGDTCPCIVVQHFVSLYRVHSSVECYC